MSDKKPEEMIIYTYHRKGVALSTGSLNLALKRNDGEHEVTMIKKIYK
jgi:hypothetical protein